uniref:SPG11 vesicle trafficking associated, spatacsin n=1 Tax=Junco hyemalis TaxID=40217 RepID=A0A8C5JPC0_JUNHY
MGAWPRVRGGATERGRREIPEHGESPGPRVGTRRDPGTRRGDPGDRVGTQRDPPATRSDPGVAPGHRVGTQKDPSGHRETVPAHRGTPETAAAAEWGHRNAMGSHLQQRSEKIHREFYLKIKKTLLKLRAEGTTAPSAHCCSAVPAGGCSRARRCPADRNEGRPRGDGGGSGRARRAALRPGRRMAAAGAPAELRVLLVPRSEQPRGAARVRLSRARHALGTVLLSGGIRLESLGPGGAAGQQRGSVLPGAWADFLWDSSEDDGSQSNKAKLLALAQSHDLFVYEFSVEDGKHNPNSLHSCEAETLKKLLEDKNISLPSISSVKILSFGNNKCKLLLNQFVLVHLAFPGEGSPPEPCGCFPLALPAGAVGRIADSHFCRGILFLLDSAGWIYMFDCCDGASLAKVGVALGAGQGQGPAPVSPLAALAVSPDLSTAVVTNSCHWALAVQLNTYFRQFPEHLFCKRDPENLPVKPAEGLDEDELASSEHSMELLPLPFRTDRSWKAHLSSLWDRVRRRRTPGSPNLVNNLNLPWYQFFTHLEDHDPEVCEDPERMVAFVPRAVTWAASPALQGQPGAAGQQWAQIPVGAAQDMVELECKLVTGAKAVFVGQAQDTGLSVALWDFESRGVTCSRFGRSSAFVECGAELPLCLLLTERGLSLVLFGVTQEEFLTRLMMFGSAGVVDSLCHLNGWERCSIPIHALEAGLENRQLDTVDLFLKSKESVFSLSAACPGAAASQSYLRSLEELRPALNLLCSAIQDNDMEPHSKPFSEQLLNLALAFLTKQLEEIFVHTEEPDEFLQKAADILTDYIIKLRKFLRRYPHPAVTPGHGAELDEDLPEIEESQKWEKLTPEEVIAEAILSNKIPEAQIFFRRQKHPAESLQEFLQTGLSLVYDCLLRGSTREASELLRNMGLDVKQELHKICLHTQDRHVRELLVKVLQEENYFSEKEKKMIDFVHQVESFYSESFQENKETEALSRCSSWRRQQELAGPRAVLGSQLGWGSPGAPRLTLTLSWALCWEPLLQDMVLLPWRAQQELKSCSAEVLWMHATAQHDWLRICSWVEEAEPSQAPCGSAAWPPLSPDIVDRSTLCSPYMRQDILNKLARKGIFVPSELEDFELLLQRLLCLGGVLQNPHPVPKYSSASGLDFHTQFVLHCLEHSLQYLLYTYLDYYSLTPANCPVLGNKELQEAHPWFEFLVQCRGVASNPRDPKMIFQASLANAQMLIPSSQGGVSSILLEGRTLLALATTVYGPGGIDQVLQNEDTEKPLKKVDPQLLKMALTPYPKLKAALFPSCTAHGILPPDISLYHLLQSLMPFDPTKLFGWQSANTLAVSDAWSQLPHFSSPALVSRHAVQERLHFLFYLRHGRPAFAFGTFLGQQLARSKAPRLLMQQAAREAQLLALSCFGVPSVAAACVCFLELLGQDSLGLRVALRAASLISSHSPTRDSLVEKLTRLADGDKAAAAAVLTSLEEAFWDNIEQQGIKRTSGDCSRQWSLVVQFCKLHSLELSTSFLRECARANEWLQFLIQSQLHGHQPAQGANLISCLCVWIITSVDDATRAEATAHTQGRAEGPQWDLQDLAVIWKVFLRKQKSKTLLNGFQLFLKDSPLLHILEMYELCMNCKKYNEAKTKLDKFQESLTNLGAAGGAAPALPLPWLRSQALFLLELMLQQCRTDYELGKLLQLLAAAESLLPDGPHLRRLCALSEALRDSSIPISRSMLSPCSLEAFQGQCGSILEQLQEKGMFSLAREVAALAELPVDSVLTHEVLRDLHHLRDSGQWHQSQSRAEFWQKCNDTFSRHCICSRAAAQFFLRQADSVRDPAGQERTASLMERQLLLTLAGHWLAKEPGVAVQELQELEKQLWRCRVAQRALLPEGSQPCPGAQRLARLAEQFSFARLAALEAAEPRGLRALPARAAPGAALGAAERAALGTLLGTLLEQGSVHEAARVCHYFQLWHRDVALALLCRALALGEAALEQLQPEVQSLLSAEASAEPGASSLEDWTPLGCGDDAVVAALKALAEECVHGRGYCRQVLCLYELSKELSCSFAEVSAREPREVLGAILARRGPERGRRAQAFIACQGLPPGTVAPLLAQQITHELLASAQGKGQKQAWNPAVESQELLQLAKLCQDHTLVGMKLLDKISSVPCGELSCITELLILAHSLFSLTCHMEGITRVLQAARLLTEEHLAPREEYGLLVRLLTGIGRYNEMTYIFELLHQKHYFEVLMRKKLDPSGTLKAALLDYTKRCRPGDSEKHNMIALCFSMCREIGQNHEAAACTQLKLIECRPWEESLQDVPNLKKLLLKAVTLFIDAAESYSKDSCVRQALRCRRQTRLITLQLHFLGSGQSTRVINLGRQELPGAILALPRFYQVSWAPSGSSCGMEGQDTGNGFLRGSDGIRGENCSWEGGQALAQVPRAAVAAPGSLVGPKGGLDGVWGSLGWWKVSLFRG